MAGCVVCNFACLWSLLISRRLRDVPEEKRKGKKNDINNSKKML